MWVDRWVVGSCALALRHLAVPVVACESPPLPAAPSDDTGNISFFVPLVLSRVPIPTRTAGKKKKKKKKDISKNLW